MSAATGGPSTWLPRPAQCLAGGAVLLVLLGSAWYLDNAAGREPLLGFSLLAGTLFGIVLQRSRFCFYCVTLDFLEQRQAGGLLGVLVALGVGILGYHAVFGAFVPNASTGVLPPGAHIGPVSLALAAGAAAFGWGMAMSGSCISAHLYRLGEGRFAGLWALFGTGIGFIAGFCTWNLLYLRLIQDAPVTWLPRSLGYGGSVAVQLGVLAIVALLLYRHARPGSPAHQPAGLLAALFGHRWPTYVGGILIGMLGTLAYLRLAPLGVTSEIGSIARTAGAGLPFFPERLEGLDTFRGCATAIKRGVLSHNGLFVLGLVGGSLAVALPAGSFAPRWPGLRETARVILGGVLMGWGAMIALGCTIGTLLSGIMAGALSGWVFAVCCFAGLWLGWWTLGRARS